MQKLQNWWKVLALGVVAAAFGLMTASCSSTEDDDETYTVTLNGAGEYSYVGLYSLDVSKIKEQSKFSEGDTVVVDAGEMEDDEFVNWTVTSGVVPLIGFDLTDEVLVFVMPAKNVTLTANWTSGPVVPVAYKVTLDAGDLATGGGFYAPGATVSIYAGTKYGKLFAGWESDDVDFEDETSYITTFTMPNYDVDVSVVWANADSAKVRFSWELAEQVSLQSIAANTADVADWYENVFLGDDYDIEDATDWPYFVGNAGVPENVYSRTLHGEDGSPNKGKYFSTFEGNYTAVATVEDREIVDEDGERHVYDIVANYILDVDEEDGKAFFEVAFDIGNFLDAGEDKGWFDDKFADDTTPPRLEKKKGAKFLKKLKKGNITYYVFKRAAKK